MGCNPRKSNRIIEGLQVGDGEIPWQVDLVIREKPARGTTYYCGGSLLSVYYVLTAGHCINDKTISGIKYTSDPKRSFVSKNVNYEKVQNPSHYGEVTFTPLIQPICLPYDKNENIELESLVVVSGWGLQDPNNKFYFPHLMRTDLFVKNLSSRECQTASTVSYYLDWIYQHIMVNCF
ncbi:unnamed protein product [Lepeophtheirus salmonis]|uniref:(salmon louse) hypothetical protein n=1 Tax=Lepeophtheirus salmonis TaxID=72036 RepID=A0A7R8CNR9_LEPSM|nr:unnamed protein product [Lepeophtheirus salmonis]CAF2877112.1 unnamed protein product [Lepeophtheirus salmonis]